MKTIVIATKNKGKIKEMKDQFRDLPVQIKSLFEFGQLPDAVEDGQNFEENAFIKASFYSKLTKCACLADDSGLEIDVLDKRPGIYSARFSGTHADDKSNNEKMLSEMKKVNADSSAASYKCVLAFVDTSGQKLKAQGECRGLIKNQPKGDNGFGYDPYFYPKKSTKSMAEMTLEEKDRISHRGKAIRKMKNLLAEYLSC